MNTNIIAVRDIYSLTVRFVELVETLSETQSLCRYQDKFIIIDNKCILCNEKEALVKKYNNSKKLHEKYISKAESLYATIKQLESDLFK